MSKGWLRTPNETPQQLGELFDGPMRLKRSKISQDICQNRHKGNTESTAAFQSIKGRLSKSQSTILYLIRYREIGATVDELARVLQTSPNAISGRITELKIKGKIKKFGTRPTRSGCMAAVWKAI